jgi:hypothetical protein
MATALLISEQRVKQLTSLDQNVRVEDITPFIIQSQDLYRYPRLGFKFFDRLKQGVIDNDLNLNEQKLLNDYIGPMLANYSLYHMLPGLKYKFVDKGILSGNSEETTQTSLDELDYLRNNIRNTAEFYDERLREYLCDQPAGTFPEYTNPGTEGLPPSHETGYFSGLVIPGWTKATKEDYLYKNGTTGQAPII